MRENLAEYMPWLLSAVSLVMMVLVGRLNRNAWTFGLGVQALWLLWIWAANKPGFLPLTAALVVVYVINYRRWGTGEGWVIADAQGERFRCWGDWGPEWTSELEKALFFARRDDAEAFAREDDDAWRIVKKKYRRPQ
jgi:hypothetical protein